MKLHLPKCLLVALFATYATMPAFSASKWAAVHSTYNPYGASGNQYYEDGKMLNSIIDATNAANTSATKIYVGADAANGVSAEYDALILKNNDNVYLGVNSWHADWYFSNLSFDTLQIKGSDGTSNNGTAGLNVEANNTVVINAVEGTLSSVTNAGTLTLNGATTINSSIVGSGTVTVNNTLTLTDFTQLYGYTATYVDHDTTVTHNNGATSGFRSFTGKFAEGTLTLGQNGSLAISSVNVESYEIADDGSVTASTTIYDVNGDLTYSAAVDSKATVIQVNAGTLTFGSGQTTGSLISENKSLVLNGGTAKWNAQGATISRVEVIADSEFQIFDMPAPSATDTSAYLTLSTVAIESGRQLTINSIWKQGVNIGVLTGDGNIAINGPNGSWESKSSYHNINSLNGFTGDISLTGRTNGGDNPYHATINTGVGGTTMGALTIAGFGQTGETSSFNFIVSGDSTLAAINLTDAATVTVNEAKTLTVSAMSGGASSTFTKAGAGEMQAHIGGFYGNLVISEGTLKATSGSTTAGENGAVRSVTVEDGATFDINGQPTYNNLTLKGNSKLSNSNTTSHPTTADRQLPTITLEGDAAMQADGTIRMVGSGHAVTTLNLGEHTLVKTGTGLFAMYHTAVTGSGKIQIDAGKVQAHGDKQNITNLSLDINSGGEFQLTDTSQSVQNLTINGGTLTIDSGLTLTALGAVHATGGTVTGALKLGSDSVVSLTKTGEGTLTIGALSTGATGNVLNVEEGTLSITALNTQYTMDINVESAGALTIQGLTINKDTHQLTQVGEASYSYSMVNGNGFRADQTKYQLFTGYAWDSTGITVDGFTISTEGTNTYATGLGAYGTVFYVNTGKHTVTGTDESATATGYHVEAGASLILTRDTSTNLTAGQVLVTTTGAGNLTLSTNAIVEKGTASQCTGTLTINNGASLYAPATYGQHENQKRTKFDLSSYEAVVLDNAHIYYLGDSTTLNNVTVNTGGASITIKDMNENASVFSLNGTTTLNGSLNIASASFWTDGTTDINSWKYIVGIEKLTGEGTLSMASTTTSAAAAKVQIADISEFEGSLSATKNNGSAVLALTNLSGTPGVKGITLDGEAETQLTVNEGNSATMSATISGAGTVTKLGAGTLTLSGAVGTADSVLTKISVSAGTLKHTGVSNVTNVSISGGNLTYGGGTADAPVTHTVTGELKSENGSGNSTLSVDANATLNVGSLNNAWGMSIAVNGVLNATGTNGVLLASNSTETISGDGSLSTKYLQVSNASSHYTISLDSLTVEGNVKLLATATLVLNSDETTITGTTTVESANAKLNFASGDAVLSGAVTNAGTINVDGGTATMNSTVTSTGTITTTEGSQLKLGEVATITANGAQAVMSNVQMSSTGISSADTTGATKGSISNANVAIAQLAEDASFTIQDMTLTNTTITAASVNIAASKVSGSVVLNVVKPTEAITAPNVSQGGTGGEIRFSYGLALVDSSSSLTLNMEVPQAILPSESGLYTLTITLNGFAEGFDFSNIDSQVVFGADSWLGKALTGASTSVTVDGNTISAGAAVAQSGGAPSVSYNATGGNVGSLVITISGLNVPEPASATLGLAALMMLCARRRRKA